MTKTFRTVAAGVALFAAVGMGSAAHAQVSQSADASAEILAALQLTNDASLDFGSLILNATSTGGTVEVNGSGTRTCNGQVICGPAGSEQPAQFTITGAANSTIDVTVQNLVNSPVTLTHTANVGSTSANHNIELTALDDGSLGGFTAFSGSETFNVGGTINLDGSEIAGTYEGSFSVTVAYQ